MTPGTSHVWLKSDLAAILAALALTAAGNSPDEYRRGFLAAVAAMAMALGVAPGDVVDIGDYTGRVGR